ncbi:MAG: NAD-dependent succinate-semialdehyde dehydrogenase [Desulfobacterales bacterium]|nr:NAD-dependent succinate-semialdehyde dehydrogenase [Desulfobacterales bacterium]
MEKIIHVNLYINGKWTEAKAKKKFQIINPATEDIVATACHANSEDTLIAISAAQKGFQVWQNIVPWERSKILRQAAILLEERRGKVAKRIAIDCGKPIAQAFAEVNAAIETLDWLSDEARRVFGDILPGRDSNTLFQTFYEPVGVTACFSAWNFPVLLPTRKIAAALAAGCSVLCRPAEEGSVCASELFKCFIDAGVPPGTINLLTGPPEEISETIMKSPIVRKISFTGSVEVGKKIIRQSADTVKRLTLELGGHAPVIVFKDVNPEKIAEGAVAAKFRNTGQVCVSPTRFFVHKAHVEKFTDTFIKSTMRLKLGNGLDSTSDIGPLINSLRLSAVEKLVETTIKEGATVVLGGKRPADLQKGFFYEPTIFTRVRDDMTVMQKEPFGPLATILSFDSFEEVIERANAIDYGLSSYIFTNSLNLAHRAILSIKTGVVSVNSWAGSTAEMPFGGIKFSGYGREGGSQGIYEYLDTKYINLNLNSI